MGRITETVKVLLIINIIFYVGSVFLGEQAYHLFAFWFPENPAFRFWQIATHMFMHGGTMHIFFNMFMLYMFGSILEQSVGQSRFLFIYFSAGLGALGLQVLFNYVEYNSALQVYLDAGFTQEYIQQKIASATETGRYAFDNNVPQAVTSTLMNSVNSSMVGASGAVFGLLTAFALMYPNLPLYLFFVPIPIKAKYLIGAYFLLNVYSAVTGHSIIGPENTAYWAHIGGGIIGLVIMWYWKKNSFNNTRWD